MTQPLPQELVTNGQTVNMIDESGGLVGVAASQLSAATAQGLRPETQDEAALRRYRRDAGLGEGLLAAGQGVASGLTIGGSDYLAGQLLDEDTKAEMLLRQQEFGDAYMAGNIAGMLAPALLTGGTSAAVSTGGKVAVGATRAVGLPSILATGAAERLGAAAGKMVLGTATGATRQIASTAVRMGVEGAIEGGLQAAGQYAGQASLANEELDLQQAMAAFGEGAVLGGLPMAGLGALGSAAARVARAPGTKKLADAILPDSMSGLVRRTADAQTIKGYTGATGVDMRQMLTSAGRDPKVRRAELAQLLRREFGDSLDIQSLEQKSAAIGKKLDAARGRLKSVISEAEAAGAKVDAGEAMAAVSDRVLSRLETGIGADQKIADFIRRDLLDKLDATANPKPPPELLAAQKASKTADDFASRAQSRLETLQDRLGETPTPVQRVQVQRLAAKADSAREASAQARAVADSIVVEPPPQPTLSEMISLRARIDKEINWLDPAASAKNKALTEVRGALQGQIDSAIGKVDPAVQEAYRAANRGYGDWADIDRVVTKRTAMLDGNRDLSLTDTVLAAGGLASGNVLGGLVAGASNKILRSSGASAWVGRKLANRLQASELRATARAAREKTGEKIREALSVRLVRGAKSAAPRTLAAYDQLRGRADRLQADREAYIAELSQRAGSLDGVGTLSAAYVSHQLRVSEYLADTLPRPIDTGAPTIGAKRAPPASEMARWERQARAATQPMTLVEDLRDGTLSSDAVAAVGATQPQLLASIRADVEAELAQRVATDRMPDSQGLAQVAILLGRPVDASQTPQVLASQSALWGRSGGQLGDSAGAQAPAPAPAIRAAGISESRASERAALPAESSLV
jgi:hypothetical protein